jgi:hypothetical protein
LLTGAGLYDHLKESHRGWVEEYLEDGEQGRQDEWTDSIAMGSQSFIENPKMQLRLKVKSHKMS